jgi:Rrf2 family protein
VQAVAYLAEKREGELTSVKELARQLHIPYHFVAKALQRLTRKGLLVSSKGPGGGFGLALPAREITLFHIVEAIDGVGVATECVLGFPQCSGENRCSVHDQWCGVRESIYKMLAGTSVRRGRLEAITASRPAYGERKKFVVISD